MSRNQGLIVAAMGLTAIGQMQAADPPTPAGAEKQVALEIKLPRPIRVGTPKNIKPAPTLEKYDEKPRPDFLVPEGTTNLALKKKVTSSDMAPIIGELNLITDGDKEGAEGSYVELGPDKQWVQIDLEKSSDIYALVVWHFFADDRVYHDVIVQVSDDADFIKGVKTVFNNDFDNSYGLGLGKNLEYIEDHRGKLISARDARGKPVRGRYVRLYSNGNTSNAMNHYVEVEVYGKPVGDPKQAADSPRTSSAEKLVPLKIHLPRAVFYSTPPPIYSKRGAHSGKVHL